MNLNPKKVAKSLKDQIYLLKSVTFCSDDNACLKNFLTASPCSPFDTSPYSRIAFSNKYWLEKTLTSELKRIKPILTKPRPDIPCDLEIIPSTGR